MRRTKIVATIGPASWEPEVMAELLAAGMNVARVNCSHVRDPLELERPISTLRQVAEEAGEPLAILLDLGGPKIRTGELVGDEMLLTRGERLRIVEGNAPGQDDWITSNHSGLAGDVSARDRVLLDDGLMELVVTDVRPDGEIHTEVVVGGALKPRKGLCLPDNEISIPALTAKDRRDLAAGLRIGVDYVALSFVQRRQDILDLKGAMDEVGIRAPIIAKIEKPQAIEHLDEILDEVDGIMVARGDLAVEVGNHRVPILQKKMLRKSNARGTLDIVATQMLQSMTDNPRPTRAEASDVANAVLDGCDAVMLSQETAVGKYPRESIEMMDRIAREVEPWMTEMGSLQICSEDIFAPTAVALVRASADMARSGRFDRMIVYTVSGVTARLLSGCYPTIPIVAVTPDPAVVRAMALYRGVIPVHMPFPPDSDAIIAASERLLLDRGLLIPGRDAIVVAGVTELKGVANMVKIIRPGQP